MKILKIQQRISCRDKMYNLLWKYQTIILIRKLHKLQGPKEELNMIVVISNIESLDMDFGMMILLIIIEKFK